MDRTAVAPPRFVTLVLLSGLSVVSLNLFLPSLSNIATTFQADYALVSLSIAGYAGVTAILQLIVGPLSDRYGRRPVILAGLAIFSAASLGCALADDIWIFLLFRMVQGVIIAGYTVSLAAIRDSTDTRESASLIGYVAMAWAIAPMLGPMFGGALDELFGWRASFWAFLCFGVGLLGLTWADLRETNLTPSRTLMDQVRDYPALVRSRRFWGHALCMGFSTGAFYAFLGGAPLVAGAVFGLSTWTLGILMGSTTVGFVFGSFLSGRLARRRAPTTMMIAGRLVACAGLGVGILALAVGIVHEATVFGACVFLGIGNGLTMPSASAGAMSVRPKLAGSASGLSGAFTVAVGAVMSAFTGAIVSVENGPYALLGMMFLCSVLGLAAALFVLRLEQRELQVAKRDP